MRNWVALGIAVGTLVVISQAQFLVTRMPTVAAVISSVLVELTNTDRMGGGLATLTVSPVLTAVAEAKAADMAAKGYFAHVSPDGLTPWHWFQQVGYKFVYAGENLAVDFSESADVQRAWMQSPTHRANIVGTQFTEIGIATAQGLYQGRPTTFVVQVFGTPAPTPARPVAAPAKVVSAPAPGPTQVAVASTITTVPPVPEVVLGESAGAYLAASTTPPWWFRIVRFFAR